MARAPKKIVGHLVWRVFIFTTNSFVSMIFRINYCLLFTSCELRIQPSYWSHRIDGIASLRRWPLAASNTAYRELQADSFPEDKIEAPGVCLDGIKRNIFRFAMLCQLRWWGSLRGLSQKCLQMPLYFLLVLALYRIDSHVKTQLRHIRTFRRHISWTNCANLQYRRHP